MTLGLVLTSEGFIKKSRLFAGNQSEPKTLQDMINDLGLEKDQVIVMDAGIATEENLTWLRESGYTYLVCSRKQHSKDNISDYQIVKKYSDGTQVKVAVKKDNKELLAFCKSDRKAYTDKAIRSRSEQLFTDQLQKVKEGLIKPRTTKNYEKTIERIGRLKERFSSAAKHYNTVVIKSTVNPSNAGDITWHRIDVIKPENDGGYVLRTNNIDYSINDLWETYRMLNHVEDSFRYMKSHLGFRPIYHQLTERAEAHLFISVLAYRIWNIISYQLKQKSDHRDWPSIKQALQSHTRYTYCYDVIKDNQPFPTFTRQCSEPTEQQRSIYHTLNISTVPIPTKKLNHF